MSPEPARLTSSCPTCVGVPAPAETATRRTALLLPDTETLLRVCRRLSGLGYAQESSAYILDGGECCLFLRVPDTTFFRLPLAFAFRPSTDRRPMPPTCPTICPSMVRRCANAARSGSWGSYVTGDGRNYPRGE